MSRADRILDLLDHLRAVELTPVDGIADALGVDRRTVLRDLALLRERGWPIRSSTGPGGGVFLERDRGLATVHLTHDEVAALWLSTRLSAAVSDVPWNAHARSGLDKVFASLPRSRARALRRIVDRIVVGRPATERVRAELGSPPAALLGGIERALTEHRCLGFRYVDRQGRRTRRLVEPHGLLVEAPAWYVLARDCETGAARMFRMDRIRTPTVSDTTFVPDFEGLRDQALAQRRGSTTSP